MTAAHDPGETASDPNLGQAGDVTFDSVDPRRTEVRRTLLLVPALVGLAGAAFAVAAAVVSGMTDGSRGWLFTIIAALLIVVTVLSGSIYGSYVALLILIIGALVADGGPNLAELIGLLTILVFAHELIRFSLDARRPSRFGPGFVSGYLTRTALTAVMAGACAVLGWVLVDRAPTAGLWIPIGVGAAALPLFARDGAEQIGRRFNIGGPLGRAVVSTLAVAAILVVVVIGSQARNEISSGDGAGAADPVVTTTTTVPLDVEIVERRTLSPWIVVLVVVVLVVLIYLILRRPEALFELEDVERRVEDNSFDLGVVGLADADDETIEVDDQALARMLRDLQLDIAAERDPGRAIRFGYAKIERTLADFSVVRSDFETEREFLTRALPTLGRAGEAMTTLTRLFEQARFGHEQVDEAMRDQALTSIDQLLAVISGHGSSDGSGNRR